MFHPGNIARDDCVFSKTCTGTCIYLSIYFSEYVLPKTCTVIYLSICFAEDLYGDIPIYLFCRRPVRGYTYLSVFPKTCMVIYLSVFLKTCTGIYLSISFAEDLYGDIPIYPSICFSEDLYGDIYLSICFSEDLYGDIAIYLFFRRPVRGYTYLSIFP